MPSPTPSIPFRHRVSLGLLGLMMVLPFVQPIHLQPIPSFYSELVAAIMGLLAASALFFGPKAWSGFPLPRIVLVPAILIVAIVIQWLAGRVLFPEVALIHALFLLWAALLACLAAFLVRDLGSTPLVSTLAWAIVLGGAISTLVAAVQFIKWPAPDWLVLADSVSSTNLGQRNHAADYFWLGVVSATCLRLRSEISSLALAVVLSVLVIGAVLTGSRGPLAYGTLLTALGAWWWLRERTSLARRALVLSVGTTAGFLLASGLMATATEAGFFGANSGGWAVDRLAYGALKGDARLTIWRDAWNIFQEAPWLGSGIGNYHWHSFEMASRTPQGMLALPAEHAHNLILQWLADYGLFATLAVLLVVAWWLRDALRQRLDTNRWWLLAALTVIGGHSLLEYPLWYGYFLGPFALLLGADDTRVASVEMPRGRLIYALATVFVVLTIVNLWYDNRRIEDSVYWADSTIMPQTRVQSVATAGLIDVAKASLLSPMATFGVAMAMSPNTRIAANQATICEAAIRFRPRPDLIGKCAALEEMRGNRQIAEKLVSDAYRAYPDNHEDIRGGTAQTQPGTP